jgi:hypothetical protein
MKIYLNPSTAGRTGGALNGKLRHLPDMIEAELKKSQFTSSFKELWLTLSYPPMYVLPGVVGIEKDFKKYYNTFPYSRLNRGSKKIEVILQAPEFSEHFDKKDHAKYKHKFKIEDKYKNISEADLARILVDKFIQAGKLIDSKTKKEDDFDFDKFEQVLLSVKEKISPGFLKRGHAKETVKANDTIISRALEIREKRKKNKKRANKLIRDLRVYPQGLPTKGLYPYTYQYTEIFLNLLRRYELMCPEYDHLYIQVGKTFEDGLKNSVAVVTWYQNGISVIDYDAYCRKNEEEKSKMVFDVIVAGLMDIATLDGLDSAIIKKVIKEVRKTGLETELLFDHIENSRHTLTITYYSKSMEDRCPIFFELTDKKTKRTKKIQIGKADNSELPLWLQKVTLTKDKIKVKSSSSVAADVYLKGMPRTMEFEIEKILK